MALKTGAQALEAINKNVFIFPVVVSENVSPSIRRSIFKNLELVYTSSIANMLVNKVSNALKSFSDNMIVEEIPLITLSEASGAYYKPTENELEPTTITIHLKSSAGKLDIDIKDILNSITKMFGVSLGASMSTGGDYELVISGKVVPLEASFEDYKQFLLKDMSKVNKHLGELDKFLYKYRNYLLHKHASKSSGATLNLVTWLSNTKLKIEPYVNMSNGKVMAIIFDVKDSVGFEGDVIETMQGMAKKLQVYRKWADFVINDTQAREARYCMRMYEGTCIAVAHDKSIIPQEKSKERFVVVS